MELENMIARITEEIYARLSNEQGMPRSKNGLEKHIDYSLLDPSMKIAQVREACETAKGKGYAAVCLPQWFTAFAKELLKGSGVKVCTFVGLPGGNSATAAKYAEVKEAVKNGADEIEIPVNVDLLKSGAIEAAKNDIEEAMMPARRKATVKIIIEAGLLSDEQKVQAVAIAKQSGADFITVSNVLSTSCVSPEELKRIAEACGGGIGIKVSGRVRNAQEAQKLIESGAQRIGTSAAV